MKYIKNMFIIAVLLLFLSDCSSQADTGVQKPVKKEKKGKVKESKEAKKKPSKTYLEENFARNKQILDEMYQDISGFGMLKPCDENKVVDGGGAPTYGEINYESLQQLIKDLNFGPKDVFYDLGSGVGKTVLQVYANSPVKKAVGIELSDTRYEGSMKALERFKKKNMIEKGRKIAFINGNILDENLKDATIIYTCSTCFSRELMEQIAKKLSKLKKGLRFLTLKKIPTPEHFGFELVKEYNLPMSWAKEGNAVYFYELGKQ